MMCQKCGKNIATVHTMTVINGVKDEKYLCSECAAKENIKTDFSFPSLNDFFGGFFEPEEQMIKELSCPTCKTTYKEFCDTGMLGCPDCYESFRDRIKGVVKKVQGGNDSHKPEKREEKANSKERDELKSLKTELKKAVKEENFEVAAQLRDKIKEIEENDR